MECQFYEKLSDNKVKCTCCNHYCQISDQKTGICGVRKNQNGKLILLVHSKPSAVHIDPIEKKPLYHFYPGTKIFSIGTIGCNFSCDFCQNHSLSMERIPDIEDFNQQTSTLTPKQVIDQCLQQKIPSIAFTYNEPTIFTEYALDICKLAKPIGIHCVYKSNGFMSKEVRNVLKDYIQGINIDLKCFYEQTYKTLSAKLEPVKDNIKFFFDNGVVTEVTTLIIPQMNDSEEEIQKIAKFLASISKEIPWHLSAFHPDYKMQDRQRTPDKTLQMAFNIAKQEGLVNVYIGNSQIAQGNIMCSCGQVIVKRNYWQTLQVLIKCPKCGQKPYGLMQ